MTRRRGAARNRRKRVRRWLSRQRTPVVPPLPVELDPLSPKPRRRPRKPTNPKETPFALVLWADNLTMAAPMYFPTREAALAAAPEGEPYSVVDVTAKAKPRSELTDELINRMRTVPATKRVIDPRRNDRMLKLAEQGLTHRQIGALVGLSPSGAGNALRRLRARAAATGTPTPPPGQ